MWPCGDVWGIPKECRRLDGNSRAGLPLRQTAGSATGAAGQARAPKRYRPVNFQTLLRRGRRAAVSGTRLSQCRDSGELGRSAAVLQTPPGLGAGPGAGTREAAALPLCGSGAPRPPPAGAFPPLWAGLAAPLRESAEKPGGRLRHNSISGVGGREAQGLWHPAGFSPAARAPRVILGPPGLLSNDLPCSSTLSKCLPSFPSCPPFFLASSCVVFFSQPVLYSSGLHPLHPFLHHPLPL